MTKLTVSSTLPYLPIVLSTCAIVFTIYAFWWINARQGTVEAIGPQYVFGRFHENKLAIQLPIALRNTGPTAIVVSGFRVRFTGADRTTLLWVGTSTDPINGNFSFKRPIVLKGFDAAETILFFQREDVSNLFEPQDVKLDAIWSDSSSWRTLRSFTLPGGSDGWGSTFRGIDIVGGVATGETSE